MGINTEPEPTTGANLGRAIPKLVHIRLWLLIFVAGILVMAVLVLGMVWAPDKLVLRGKASDDAYLKAITDTRTTLVQAVGGFAVFLGVCVALLTLLHNRQQFQAGRQEHLDTLDANRLQLLETLSFNRESLAKTAELTERGQITERFSRSIDQLGRSGDEALELRVGGIYSLQQIVRDSAAWHNPVAEVLAAFIREHARGLPFPEGKSISEQRADFWSKAEEDQWKWLPADIKAALDVLAERDRTRDKQRLDLSRVDFQRIRLKVGLNLQGSAFHYAKLAFSRLGFMDLGDCLFLMTDLRGSILIESNLAGSDFFGANLAGADLTNVRLDGTEFAKTDLSEVRGLTVEQLKAAKLDQETTRLPANVDPKELGWSTTPQLQEERSS